MNEGWISRRKGRFVYRYMTIRASDGKRVENLKVIGLISDLKTEKAALIEATKKGYTSLASTPAIGKLSFDDLAKHYIVHELDKSEGKIGRKASETITRDKHNINKHCVPRWGTTPALNIKPLALEAWYESLSEELAWQTIAKIRSAMSQVFNHGYRHVLLPGNKHENPVALSRCPESSAYEAVVVTPEQMIVMLNELDTPKTQMEWMIALLHAATALRPEEAFGLQWQDVDWNAGRINIQRAWSKGEPTAGKNRGSMTQVVMSPVLAEALRRWNRLTIHREPSDWLFPSLKEKGRIPRSASICSKCYLRPAAIKAGVIPKDYAGRFGWHNMRHSLATFLSANDVHLSVTQSILRHKKSSTTADIYTHAVNARQIEAQQKYLSAIGMRVIPGTATGTEGQKQRA
jgi:integrase